MWTAEQARQFRQMQALNKRRPISPLNFFVWVVIGPLFWLSLIAIVWMYHG